LAQQVFLTLTQVCRHLEYPVPGELRKTVQEIRCEGTTAGTQFQDVAGGQCAENRCALARQDLRKQGRTFGRRNKIAAGAEFCCACTVVAESRRIQGMLHELCEADATAGFPYRLPDERCNSLAVSQAVGIR